MRVALSSSTELRREGDESEDADDADDTDDADDYEEEGTHTANTPRVVSGITLYNSKVNDSCEKV